MSFKNHDEYDPLPLPIKGKTYKVPSPDAKTGLWIHGMVTAAAQVRAGVDVDDDTLSTLTLDDDDERDLHVRILGTAYDEMVADAVPWHLMKLAGETAVLWVAHGRATAEAYWNAGGTPPKARAKKAAKKPKRSAPAAPPA